MFPLAQIEEMITSGHPFFTEIGGPQRRLFELPAGHRPMFSRPAYTARLLDEITIG
jgi:hypothetical protein